MILIGATIASRLSVQNCALCDGALCPSVCQNGGPELACTTNCNLYKDKRYVWGPYSLSPSNLGTCISDFAHLSMRARQFHGTLV